MSDTTLPRMFWNRVEKSATRPAQQFKDHGAWRTLTWREVGEAVRELTAGLVRRANSSSGELGATTASHSGQCSSPTFA